MLGCLVTKVLNKTNFGLGGLDSNFLIEILVSHFSLGQENSFQFTAEKDSLQITEKK
jgi:hypothetical protein